jgi:hypothetical protein
MIKRLLGRRGGSCRFGGGRAQVVGAVGRPVDSVLEKDGNLGRDNTTRTGGRRRRRRRDDDDDENAERLTMAER